MTDTATPTPTVTPELSFLETERPEHGKKSTTPNPFLDAVTALAAARDKTFAVTIPNADVKKMERKLSECGELVEPKVTVRKKATPLPDKENTALSFWVIDRIVPGAKTVEEIPAEAPVSPASAE